MKNVPALKNSTTDSPKTPGGISRSLLTPCRRVGLSRNFRKSGSSPFQSPLSSNKEVKQVNIETRKRKESLEEIQQTPENVEDNGVPEVAKTPTRSVDLPRRKKSKTLLASINKNCEDNEIQQLTDTNVSLDKKNKTESFCQGPDAGELEQNSELTPIHTKSLHVKRSSKKNISPLKESTINIDKTHLSSNPTSTSKIEEPKKNNEEHVYTNKKSPNNLTKECIVVIQKKIFKKELIENVLTPKPNKYKQKNGDISSQALFDSDSDDIPLICLNNKETSNKIKEPYNTTEEDNFTDNKAKIPRPDNTKSSKTKNSKSPKLKKDKMTSKIENVHLHKSPVSQSSMDDDDDFFEKKKTILIRKSYDKVIKPHKAKSTGSITQKDIDDIKARIETKKKMLLARANSEDTKELRDLIKKWQKGCQEALMQLMELMKNKMPDKQNMDYSEMLQTLKIPASLVGYDSDNECFLTPDDESIILAHVK